MHARNTNMPSTFAEAAQAQSGESAEHEYRLLRSGPEVPEDEIENVSSPALEVMILWESTVLHVAHLTPPRSFHVGEESVDYRLPSEKLGVGRMPVVLVDGSSAVAVVPAGAHGTVDLPGAGSLSLDEARAREILVPCAALAGAEQIALSAKTRVRIEAFGFTFQTAAVAAGKRPKGGLSRSVRALATVFGASAAFHAGLIAALMMDPGRGLEDDAAGLDRATQAYLLQLQKSVADREMPEQDDPSDAPSDAPKAGGTGSRHRGAEGMMGELSKPATNGHYQIKGPPETREATIARTRALIDAGDYGALGALSSVFGSSARAPTVFDSDALVTIGRDPNDFAGNLLGDHPGDSFGYNGLGVTGTGPGGGGPFDGIGLGRIGDFGHGNGPGDGIGPGGGSSLSPRGRKPRAVKMIETGTDVTGGLPRETVKRIIRANFPRFRACYEQGLKKDPGLRGTVAVRFIVDTTGAVESAGLSGGTLSDAQVSSCVLGVYRTLSFPEPEGGKVMVAYPIDFQNDD
jgi:hypothetical protein